MLQVCMHVKQVLQFTVLTNTLAVKQANKSNWQPKQLISEVAKNKS